MARALCLTLHAHHIALQTTFVNNTATDGNTFGSESDLGRCGAGMYVESVASALTFDNLNFTSNTVSPGTLGGKGPGPHLQVQAGQMSGSMAGHRAYGRSDLRAPV